MSDTLEHFEGLLREYMQGNASRDAVDVARDTLRTALAAAQGAQWHPIDSVPKDGRKIIVSYVNHNGKTRTVMARWLTQEAADEIDHEGVGLEAGWFECIDNWSDYTEVAIHEGEPTHWMPNPAAPGASPPAALAVPDGWALETGVGGIGEKGDRWACVRHLESQCGQDFYEDRDPLIFAFLSAMAAAPQAPADTQAPAQGQEPTHPRAPAHPE